MSWHWKISWNAIHDWKKEKKPVFGYLRDRIWKKNPTLVREAFIKSWQGGSYQINGSSYSLILQECFSSSTINSPG